jgi:hypothetical protein
MTRHFSSLPDIGTLHLDPLTSHKVSILCMSLLLCYTSTFSEYGTISYNIPAQILPFPRDPHAKNTFLFRPMCSTPHNSCARECSCQLPLTDHGISCPVSEQERDILFKTRQVKSMARMSQTYKVPVGEILGRQGSIHA